MKKVQKLKSTQFYAILRAFNAPFLDVFASVEAYMHPSAAWDIATKSCDAINVNRYAEERCNYAEELQVSEPLARYADTPSVYGFSFSWTTRNGNKYRFGQENGMSNYSYWVEYPTEAYLDDWGDKCMPTMRALIEYLADGTPIPQEYHDRYPYADNPYLRFFAREKPSKSTKRRGN
jgi:hypothetical protein